MQSQITLKRHANLVDRMATRLGIDLEEAAFRGRISTSEIEDAVLRCTACTRPCACEALLAQPASTSDKTPDFCRNTEAFDRLGK